MVDPKLHQASPLSETEHVSQEDAHGTAEPDAKVHCQARQLIRHVDGYLNRRGGDLAVPEVEEYFSHLPGMDILIAQAQSQQQQ